MGVNRDYDWDEFGADEYSQRNYGSPRSDDLWMARHLAHFYAALPEGLDVVDVGTGPSLLTLLAAAGRARSIVVWELAGSNIAWMREQLGSRSDLPENWKAFWQELQKAEPGMYGVENPMDTLRSLVELRQESIFDLPERSWDVASMFFVAESMTEDLEEFRQASETLARAVKPGGAIVAAFMEGSIGYSVGDMAFPAVRVGIGEVAGAFANQVDSIEVSRVPDGGNRLRTGYDGMLYMTATVRANREKELDT